MKIVIDVELTQRAKRALLVAGLLIVGGLTNAFAAIPNTFNSGDPLSSAKLNENFSSIDTRLSALEPTRYTAIAVDGGSGGGTINRQAPSAWVSSITRNSAGDYTLNIAAGTFSSAPICSVTGVAANAAFVAVTFKIATDTGPSASAIRVTTSNTGFAYADTGFDVVCVGNR